MVNETVDYHFTYMPKKKLDILNEKLVKAYLKKWGLEGRIQSQCFTFNESVHHQDMNRFLEAFFASPDVYPHLRCDPTVPISAPLTALKIARIPCTLTDMRLFERLTHPANGIVLREFDLRQCLQRDIDGFLVADELRQLLLDKESDNLYKESERDEFLFRLFEHCCLGGMWCQYEDSLEPYLTVTKLLYKNLISVVKCDVTNNLLIRSQIFKVSASEQEGDVAKFPRDPEQDNNFAYVIVNSNSKQVATLVHQAGWNQEVVE
ncbi:hypothetical protein M8J77_005927 [Diaphorina citri]|nr:hypothetical protein M8J77_005927 [Diaphorina citri]